MFHSSTFLNIPSTICLGLLESFCQMPGMQATDSQTETSETETVVALFATSLQTVCAKKV